MAKEKSYVGLILVLLLLAGAGAVAYPFVKRSQMRGKFPEAVLRQYEKELGSTKWVRREGTIPPRTGKVVVVAPSIISLDRMRLPLTQIKAGREVEPPALHDAMFDLDPAIRAKTPDEVDTVIFCEKHHEMVGIYAREGQAPVRRPDTKALRLNAKVIVFDRRSKKYLGEYMIQGGDPPKRISDGGAQYGEPADVAGFIEKMPVRAP